MQADLRSGTGGCRAASRPTKPEGYEVWSGGGAAADLYDDLHPPSGIGHERDRRRPTSVDRREFVFHSIARNFNPLAIMAGRLMIADPVSVQGQRARRREIHAAPGGLPLKGFVWHLHLVGSRTELQAVVVDNGRNDARQTR